MEEEVTLTVSEDLSGERLDRFLSEALNNLSRSLIQKLIEKHQVLVNEKPSKSGYKLRADDKVLVSIPEPEEARVKPEAIELDVFFEDKDVIVINKVQGMITHPASGIYEGTLVNALLNHCKSSLSGINGVLRPGIVHRLDKETSGLIIACKNDQAHSEIAKQIHERELKRHYLAIVHGKVIHDRGTINKPIGRDKIHRHRMAVVNGGRNAITHWNVLKKFDKFTLLECMLETGRTHQIRVHMKSLGHPVVGDIVYGKKSDPVKKMMLHAYKLGFVHPRTKKEIKLEAEMPSRFKEFLMNVVK